MSKLTDLSITEALSGLAAKKFSAVELTDAHIKAVEKARPLNAFITETPEIAARQAKESDARRASGKAGALDGIPLAMKDLYCTKGVRTTAASKILHNFVPTYESTVSQKLADAGSVMLGKVNLDEFARGSGGTSSHFGPTISPWSGAEPAKATRKLVHPRRFLAVSPWVPPAPIPAVLSASPPLSPALSASSQPMDAAHAMASSPLPHPSTKRVP